MARDLFWNVCKGMGDDNDNCDVCPLQGACNARPHEWDFDDKADFEEAKAEWHEEAERLAEKAIDVFDLYWAKD